MRRKSSSPSNLTPLTVHWYRKILLQDDGSRGDRLAIFVTGQGVEKLLRVRRLPVGTGEAATTAVYETLEDGRARSSSGNVLRYNPKQHQYSQRSMHAVGREDRPTSAVCRMPSPSARTRHREGLLRVWRHLQGLISTSSAGSRNTGQSSTRRQANPSQMKTLRRPSVPSGR